MTRLFAFYILIALSFSSQASDVFPVDARNGCEDDYSPPHEPPPYSFQVTQNKKWLVLVSRRGKQFIEPAIYSKSKGLSSKAGKPLFFIELTDRINKMGELRSYKFDPKSGEDVWSRILKQRIHANNKTWRFVSWVGGKYIETGASRWARTTRAQEEIQTMEKKQINEPPSTELAFPDSELSKIIWAGDLNHDGEVDFIATVSGKESWGYQLWISEKGQNGEIMFVLVAETWLAGCA